MIVVLLLWLVGSGSLDSTGVTDRSFGNSVVLPQENEVDQPRDELASGRFVGGQFVRHFCHRTSAVRVRSNARSELATLRPRFGWREFVRHFSGARTEMASAARYLVIEANPLQKESRGHDGFRGARHAVARPLPPSARIT